MAEKLWLIRHGRTAWNAQGRIQGWADVPLDEVGREQARRLAERLRASPPDRILCSPLWRAYETAQILAAAWGVPVEVDERLKERGQGPLEGRTGVEVAALREAWRQFEQDPTAEIAGVEPRAVFAARVWAAMQAAMDRPERALAIVAHGGTFAMFFRQWLGLPLDRPSPFRFDNTSLTELVLQDGRWMVRLLNDTCHLDMGGAQWGVG
ncbi:histidine phosphatase family protein [Thermoflexus sp.]|uniref:histidine phosphatase family protein n=2 Tax=Thermoflexus sp. TaxID=1969742 RepID=UPI0025F5EE14|nr:histidine phosphatase family protein [Thermoflexus sp.]MCS6964130.1 histidine phosphatase family protein [Thermoflexus sp.]MDW8065337.1 histidine phosphatase family protein [Anaerolineae bacterium]MDW8186213.1 histidine phosphatase family protein [Anaerolineae bacterium]